MPRKRNAALALDTFGHLYAGGRIDPSVEGLPTVGQLYAEYWIPKTLRSPCPIVMIHGGSQTGTNFTSTPDGREGWAQYFLRRGHSVYVVDQVARGRAAHFSQSQGPVQAANLKRTEDRFVAPKRAMLWPQAKRHAQWPGSGRPGDPAFDAFYATQFPSLESYARQQELNRNALIALLDRIGPSVLLAHSQGGAFLWPVADARPKLVKAIVAVEPNGPPVYETDLKGAPEWFADIGPRKPYGLGMVPLTYRPPLKPGEELKFVRQDKPDGPGLVRGWLQAEPARKLPNLAKISILILVAEASYHATYDHVTAAYLAQAGVPNDFIRLEDIGIRGNGHMMMLEKNSDVIAGLIETWLKKALAKSRPRRAKR
ncbi:MAG: alpha/beta fold hydrolase [Alphaproteobacteria bacterium]|nr:alpha/beta fold hydrolase [Alphaproteobacteria bacterium]